jgi:hypothetical protein
MKRESRAQDLLDELVRAARNEPATNIDIPVLEAQLRKAWLAQSPSRNQPTARKRDLARWVPVALAAAVVLVVGIAGVRHLSNGTEVPVRTADSLGVDEGRLYIGQSMLTGALPTSVALAGKAKFTLAPRSQVRVTALSPCLTLALDAGRIDCDVVPSKRAETFAIETQTHRIAVHGTKFSVEVDEKGLWVDVTSGAVLVTRHGQAGPDDRALLTAPRRLRFDAEAAISSRAIEEPIASATRNRPKPLTPTVVPSMMATEPVAPGRELPLQPTALEQETALDVVRAAAARCFAQALSVDVEPHSDVRVRVETQLTLSISPSGSIQDLSFIPPVLPEMAECTRRETAGWSATPSRLGASPSRAIILTK